MKLFTKDIDKKLFAQFPKGSDLESQMVVAKIFNPYGRGTWYIINSDPDDPDYLWAIVDLFDIEVGSVSRSELETIKVPPFRLGLERDMYFEPKNAAEVFRGLQSGKQYAEGGKLDIAAENKGMLLNYAEELEHHAKEFEVAAKNAEQVEPWVIAKIERATTDLSDVTHYLASNNAIREEELSGEEIDDFDRGGEIKSFDVIYFKEIKSRDGSTQKVIRDRSVREGSLEKILSKAYAGFYPNDVVAEIRDKSINTTVARITPDGKGTVIADGYGLNVGEIELEQEIEEVEDKPKKKLFGLFAKGGIVVTSVSDIPDLEEKIKEGKVSYRGLGIGKLYNQFYDIAGQDGVRLKVGSKEYYITDDDFNKIGRGADGKIRIKFDAPERKGYAKGGVIESGDIVEGAKFKTQSGIVWVIDEVGEYDEKNGWKLVKTSMEGGEKNRYRDDIQEVVAFLNEEGAVKYAMGGKVTFDDKVKAVKSSLLKRKKVSPKVQKDYGKTYSPKEAEESAKRIVGAMTAKERLMKRMKK